MSIRKGFGKGKSPKKFSFTYENYAEILGCTIEAARKHAQRGHYDPSDLVSVMEFVRDRLQKEKLDEEREDARGSLRERGPSMGGHARRENEGGILQQDRGLGKEGLREHIEERVGGMVVGTGAGDPSVQGRRGKRGAGRRPGYSREGGGF